MLEIHAFCVFSENATARIFIPAFRFYALLALTTTLSVAESI